MHQYGTRAAIVHSISCMSGVLGLDLSTPLPPFPPRFRGQDGVFGALTSRCVSGALFGLPDYAFLHNAALGRICHPGYVVRFSTLILAGLQECSAGAVHGRALPAFGRWMLEAAICSETHFQNRMRESLVRFYAGAERAFAARKGAAGRYPAAVMNLQQEYGYRLREIQRGQSCKPRSSFSDMETRRGRRRDRNSVASVPFCSGGTPCGKLRSACTEAEYTKLNR